MSVILKKDAKVGVVVGSLNEGYTKEAFISKFKELYPSDWTKLEKEYGKYLRKHKPGKIIPMPKPEQYILNALHVWKNSRNEESN